MSMHTPILSSDALEQDIQTLFMPVVSVAVTDPATEHEALTERAGAEQPLRPSATEALARQTHRVAGRGAEQQPREGRFRSSHVILRIDPEAARHRG